MLHAFMVTIFAQAPSPVPGEDLFGWLLESVKWTVEQFQAHNYMPAVGMLIMLLIWVFRAFFQSKLSAKALPWVSAGLGVLAAIGANLLALVVGHSTMDWVSAVAMGLTMGAAASGFWSMLGKKLMGKPPLP